MAEEVREVREEEPKREVVVEKERTSSAGMIVAVVVGLILIALLLIYGIPALSGGSNSSTDVNVTMPTTGTGTQQY